MKVIIVILSNFCEKWLILLGKGSSSEIQTRISGKGEVHTTVKKYGFLFIFVFIKVFPSLLWFSSLLLRLIGSLSHWKLHGVYDPKTNKGTEIGEVTFGVHTNHGDNSIIYHGAVISVEPNANNHKQADSAGWMKITGKSPSLLSLSFSIIIPDQNSIKIKAHEASSTKDEINPIVTIILSPFAASCLYCILMY